MRKHFANVLGQADLVEEVVRALVLTKSEARVIVHVIFDSLARSLQRGEGIEIRGFGSFGIRQRKSRVGRNPKTGARVEVESKKVAYFKPSKQLKRLIE